MKSVGHPLDEIPVYLLEIFQNHYHELKQCYVVMRKGVIDDALAKMQVSILALEKLLVDNPLDETKVFYHFQQIFYCIDCIQFNAHRDSKSSKHLFDEAHLARRNMRKALRKIEIGQQFLRLVAWP